MNAILLIITAISIAQILVYGVALSVELISWLKHRIIMFQLRRRGFRF